LQIANKNNWNLQEKNWFLLALRKQMGEVEGPARHHTQPVWGKTGQCTPLPWLSQTAFVSSPVLSGFVLFTADYQGLSTESKGEISWLGISFSFSTFKSCLL
jgi:hypothetical protein